MKFDRLFSPIEIKPGFTLKNRILMPALHHNYTPDGSLTDRLCEYYKTRARGGVGLIIIGACRFEDTGAKPSVVRLASDEDVEMWRPLVQDIHDLDCKVAVQLFHAGRYVANGANANGSDALSPSAVYSSYSHDTPREITVEEIHQLIRDWAAGAVRAKAAGFDAVEIIGSAGYLISQFLSPITNLRTDDYGGTPEKRRRFPLEVIRAVRKAVGADYPIIFRLSGKDFMPGSNGLEEAKAFAVEAEQAGVDLLNITGGWHETTVPQLPGDLPRGGLSYLAEGIKSVVHIPVSACNRINSPAVAEEILAQGKADMVGMGRALLADPELPNKAKHGRTGEIRPCIACNQGCLVGAFFDRPVRCLTNGLCGHEAELKPQPCDGGKVLVIGGGPAGCECAIRLAQRGYQVTLWEKTNKLGGQLNLAAACPAKSELPHLLRYYQCALRAEGVLVEMNKPATAEAVQAAGFERVIVANGGAANPVKLPDTHGIPVATTEDILTGEVIPGKRVVIVGGGFKGVETARYLARKSSMTPEELFYFVTQQAESMDTIGQMVNHSSREITLVEQEKKIGIGYEPGIAWTGLQELRRLGVKTHKLCRLVSTTDHSVLCEQTDKEGSVTRIEIPCDTIVYSAGVHEDESLTEAIRALGIQAVSLGNCTGVARAIEQITAATRLGCTF